MLDVGERELSEFIGHTKELSVKWARSERWATPPDRSSTDRPSHPAIRNPPEIVIDEKELGFVNASKAVGLDKVDVERQVAHARLAAQFPGQLLQSVGGGMISNLSQAQKLADMAAERLMRDDYDGEVPDERTKARTADQDFYVKVFGQYPVVAKTLSELQMNAAKIAEMRRNAEREERGPAQTLAFGTLSRVEEDGE